MKFTIDSTTDQVQSTGGIALAAKISEKIGFNFSDNISRDQLVHPEIVNNHPQTDCVKSICQSFTR